MAGSLHLSPVKQIAAAVLFVATLSGCQKVRVKADTTGDRRTTLRADIDALLNAPELAHGYWGVVIKSLRDGDTLYSVNARKLMMPASNMKIVTLAAAAEKLGWDFRYETTVRAVGTIENGALDGDVVVVGSGDPSLVASDGTADRLFAEWASRLKGAGIRTVNGRVIGNDKAFDGERLGFGWSWDDLPDDYAAGVGALQLNEDAVLVTISPGPSVGASAAAAIGPVAGGLAIDNGVITTAADGQPAVHARRLPGSRRLSLRGTVPAGHAPVVIGASVDNPTQFFVDALRAALIANGIDVRGAAVDIDDASDAPPSTSGRAIVSYQSPPLATLAQRLMKASQNQYAETLLKTAGPAQPILQSWGIDPGELIQRDGSGLSRYDYVTPESLVAILMHIDRDPKLKEAFEASLPVAGRDGSLTNRMKGTVAEGNARAKTGSMSNVRALSGYVTSGTGEPLVFSIIANNFDVPPGTINRTADAIVVRLAQFTR